MAPGSVSGWKSKILQAATTQPKRKKLGAVSSLAFSASSQQPPVLLQGTEHRSAPSPSRVQLSYRILDCENGPFLFGEH